MQAEKIEIVVTQVVIKLTIEERDWLESALVNAIRKFDDPNWTSTHTALTELADALEASH